jgi:hypothetical protein
MGLRQLLVLHVRIADRGADLIAFNLRPPNVQ